MAPPLPPQEFYAAGEFSFLARLRTSLRANLKFYCILLLVGVAMVVYMLATKTVELSNVVPFVLTLSNTWGLLIVVFMLGYGLVEVPRLVWRQSNPEYALRLLEFTAPDLDTALFDSKCGLEEVIAEVGEAHTCRVRATALGPRPSTPPPSPSHPARARDPHCGSRSKPAPPFPFA